MKKINYIIAASISATMLTGCSGISRNLSNLLFPPYPSSDQRRGETVSLDVAYREQNQGRVLCQKNEVGFMPGSEKAAALIISQLENFLEEESKRYTASYTTTAIGDSFWYCKQIDDEKSVPNVNLKEITINRKVDGGKISALEATFMVLPLRDHTGVAILPRSIDLKKSKAKVALFDITRPFGFDLLAPWTALQILDQPRQFLPWRPSEIDMKFDFSIIGIWATGSNNAEWHNQEVASQSIVVSGVTIGNTDNSMECAKEGKDSTGKEVKLDDIINVDKTGYSIENVIAYYKNNCPFSVPATILQSVPRSEGSFFSGGSPSGEWSGLGNFIIKSKVTEFDSFGERITELNKDVKNNEGNIIDFIKNGI